MIRWQRRRGYIEVYAGNVRFLWNLANFGAPRMTDGFPQCYIFTCGPLWIEWPEAGHASE